MSDYERIREEIQKEFRWFRVICKDRSPLMKSIHYGLLAFLWCPAFMRSYTTVILFRVYMPAHLIGTPAGARVLRHERVHMRDCLRSGVLPFVISYLFLLPFVFTFRSVWEMRAYEETMRAELDETGDVSEATLAHIQRQFTASAYLWMCPFPRLVRRWLERVRRRVVGSTGRSP
jgi:hypothetical protein